MIADDSLQGLAFILSLCTICFCSYDYPILFPQAPNLQMSKSTKSFNFSCINNNMSTFMNDYFHLSVCMMIY